MPLREYARRRNFEKTAEPKAASEKGRGGSRFVIQKHAATRLHYDFRLEMDGVLKSWAVPKGIPLARGDKRLAVQVEDHPVSYINFEGVIPKGQYGGGTVMVWDRGRFSTDGRLPAQELKSGKLHLTLSGKKLHGNWHLVQLRGGPQWLLIKGGDSLRPISKKLDEVSALSGRTMQQLSGQGAVGNARPKPKKKPSRPGAFSRPHSNRGTRRFQFIEPMKARMVETPPAPGRWIYEIKFDGFRALAFKDEDEVRLLSRNGKDFGGKFPEVADSVAALGVQDAILDGEIVALDRRGISSFQLLQAFELGEKRPPIFFYVFDLLRLDGKDLRSQTLVERKEQLEKILKTNSGVIRLSAALGEDAGKLLRQARKLGLEGLIGKRKDSVYEAGRRSGAWIKLKLHREQELVIGGFTDPEGSRPHFGALLVGFYQDKKLKFCGKVGTGFNEKSLTDLYSHFQRISRDRCPFVNLPETPGSRYSPRLTATEMKKCHWVRPELVGQIKFSEWTWDDKLRQPVFLGLRQDKDASEVVRE